MGSCVSVNKDPESVMKLRLSIGSKNDKLLIPSPVKEKSDTVKVGDRTVADVAVKSRGFLDTGSKDEAFFDSQPWLESDCEDDFLSVNGDFTPSRGNTPVHHSFTLGNILVNTPSEEEPTHSAAEPSMPSDKKKRLSELFKESLRVDESVEEVPARAAEEANGLGQRTRSTNGTPYFSRATSGGSNERTPNRVLGAEERSLKSSQCCLPGLLSSRSLNERKNKTSPPRIPG